MGEAIIPGCILETENCKTMKTEAKKNILASTAIALCGVFCGNAEAQTLLNETGTTILAPVIAPTGGYALNPQEYLSVGWSVSENASDIYTYSYTVSNPGGDVLMTDSGGLTATPEIFETFGVGFDTTAPGAYISGTEAGSPNELVGANDLTWFFSPSIPAGSSAATVSFQSYLPPVPGGGDAEDSAPPSPWSQDLTLGEALPVPGGSPVPDGMSTALLGLPSLLLFAIRSTVLRRPTQNQC